jgi:peptide deformylase
MAIKDILLMGNPLLYQKAEPITFDELSQIKGIVNNLHDTLMNFRKIHKCGRAIAAPQIGIMKQLIYMNIDKPIVFINPIIDQFSTETFELWDDCMSFPNLLVKVRRFKSCRITYKNLDWVEQEMFLNGDLSELLQHEFDHLEGTLAVQRAIDQYSFAIKAGLSNPT